ncbi:PrgI family protein [Candidatus Gottesmanbacteria bacterium]|nr:PrgI family protein [Candidatus Gottesmanbacteria bacterium]
MEQHPIPRNISGFQFHLVGDMTLKQFGYLAGGIIVAYLLFKSPFPSIFTLPLAGLSALAGFAFAFVPIQERSLDRWLIAFIKSVYSPTQYLWKKANPPLAILTQHISQTVSVKNPQTTTNHQVANQKLNAYLSSLPLPLDKTINKKEKAYIDKTLSLFTNQPSQVHIAPPSPIIAAPKPPSVSQKPPPPKPTIPPPPPKTDNNLSLLEKKLQDIIEEKEKLVAELAALRSEKIKTDEIKPLPPRPIIQESAPPKPIQEAISPKTIASSQVKDVAGMPSVPTVGNIILGVVRDNLNMLLPGIIISVKDLTGMPVRALKTNKLGQFASATPLANGDYIIEIEDPQNRFIFDQIKITLAGKIFMPIEVIAKGQREIMRAKLTKELFSPSSM